MAAVCCKPFGDFFCPSDKPSPIFSTFSCCINGLGIIWSIIRLASRNNECESAARTWLILGIITMAGNCFFAFYIYFRFAHKVRQYSASKAAWKLFMYDWGVCMHWFWLIWHIVWMVVASGRSNSGLGCDSMINIVIVLLILYLAIGSVLVCFSIMTEGCRTPAWRRNHQGGEADTYGGGGRHNQRHVEAQPYQPRAVTPPPSSDYEMNNNYSGAYSNSYAQPQQQQPQPYYTTNSGVVRPPPAVNPNWQGNQQQSY